MYPAGPYSQLLGRHTVLYYGHVLLRCLLLLHDAARGQAQGGLIEGCGSPAPQGPPREQTVPPLAPKEEPALIGGYLSRLLVTALPISRGGHTPLRGLTQRVLLLTQHRLMLVRLHRM